MIGHKKENNFSFDDCKVIATVGLGAIKYSDVPRSWIIPVLKRYQQNVPVTCSEDNAVKKLSPELVKRKIVDLKCEPGQCITRCMVKRLQKL